MRCDDARGADVRRVGVEDAVVVRLAVLGEDLADERVGARSRRSRGDFSTIRQPPLGMIARLSGASVCRPTISSWSSVDVARARATVIVDGVCGVDVVDAALALGGEHRASAAPTARVVRAVGPARNAASPA